MTISPLIQLLSFNLFCLSFPNTETCSSKKKNILLNITNHHRSFKGPSYHFMLPFSIFMTLHDFSFFCSFSLPFQRYKLFHGNVFKFSESRHIILARKDIYSYQEFYILNNSAAMSTIIQNMWVRCDLSGNIWNSHGTELLHY